MKRSKEENEEEEKKENSQEKRSMQCWIEMSDNPCCCLTCAVDNGNIEEIKKLLDSDGLSDAHAFSLGHDLLWKPKKCWNVRLKNFLLKRGAGAIGESKNRSETPLCWNGSPLCQDLGTDNIEIMKSLLEAQDDVQKPTSLDAEPLHVAALLDNTEIAKVLLDHIYRDKNRPRCDVVKNNLETVKTLLQASIDVDERFPAGLTVYKIATELAQKEIRKILFSRLYNDDRPDVYRAAAMGSINALTWRLQQKADVEERSYNDLTPLHIAAKCGNTECAAILLDHGADLNTVCASALSALTVAAVKNGKEELIELLLRKMPNINAMFKNGDTLLHVAARRGNFSVVQLLLNKGCDIDARDKNNKNIVHRAIERRDVSLLEQLIGARTDSESSIDENRAFQSKIFESANIGISEKDANDRSRLLLDAVYKGCLKIAEYLLNLGDKFNTEMMVKADATLLHVAILRNNIEMVELLIKKKADVNAKDKNGVTPLNYAVVTDTCPKSVDSNDSDSNTDMYRADRSLRYGNIKIVEMLLDEGANVNAKGNNGTTALHFASKLGGLPIMSLLLRHGADINIMSNDGKTPVDGVVHGGTYNECFSEQLLMFREHMIKMKALGRWVCDRNLEALKSFGYGEYIHKRCTDEIEFMRRTIVGASNVSYYDLLTKGTNRLAFYSRNKDIAEALETGNVKNTLRQYWDMLHRRYINGRTRAALLDTSLRSFRILTTNALPDSSIIELFDYLSNEDLKKLIKAAPLDESDN